MIPSREDMIPSKESDFITPELMHLAEWDKSKEIETPNTAVFIFSSFLSFSHG
jgi:hypothetical protein